eukprot:6175081-Pleurochrysis_carterae.AAC.1
MNATECAKACACTPLKSSSASSHISWTERGIRSRRGYGAGNEEIGHRGSCACEIFQMKTRQNETERLVCDRCLRACRVTRTVMRSSGAPFGPNVEAAAADALRTSVGEMREKSSVSALCLFVGTPVVLEMSCPAACPEKELLSALGRGPEKCCSELWSDGM